MYSHKQFSNIHLVFTCFLWHDTVRFTRCINTMPTAYTKIHTTQMCVIYFEQYIINIYLDNLKTGLLLVMMIPLSSNQTTYVPENNPFRFETVVKFISEFANVCLAKVPVLISLDVF